jgi:hypothetical protein
MPAERWLSAQARCMGNASIGATPLEWWKMPALSGADPSATWFWHRSDSRLPWRAMFTRASSDPPIIGEYALTYFSTFESVTRTNLAALRDLCRAAPSAAGTGEGVRALMTDGGVADSERTRRVETLLPGLGYRACSSVRAQAWPRRFSLTAVMTPTTFAYGPFSAEVFYDWEGARTLLTRLRDPDNPRSPASIDALLVGEEGFDIRRHASGELTCRAGVYPGTIRQDWMIHDKCQCRGVIANNANFGARDTVQILSCPIEHASTFWAIYKSNGQPVTFRSTALNQEGLTLADYYHWRPEAPLPPEVLTVPAQCRAEPPLFSRPNAFERAGLQRDFAARCSGCHVVGR